MTNISVEEIENMVPVTLMFTLDKIYYVVCFC